MWGRRRKRGIHARNELYEISFKKICQVVLHLILCSVKVSLFEKLLDLC